MCGMFGSGVLWLLMSWLLIDISLIFVCLVFVVMLGLSFMLGV